jgi:alkanesulfonate monooxygenase SsuD/methylene tetrahydromethanopterin reductase-like flavin-dependent oxidoreductase (luciferase family)
MKIGTFQLMSWEPGREPAQHYYEALEQMVTADRLGFYSCWLAEHHFPRPTVDGPNFSVSADPLTFLSNVAAKTERIKLGTGVMVLQWDNPIRTAERAAILDIMSGGRLELGVGRGGSVWENASFKAPRDHGRERFQEAIEVILGAWTEDALTYHGQFFDIDNVRIYPKPLQKPRPPLYVAAVSPESFDWVGRLGLPFAYVGANWEPVEKGTWDLQKQWYEDGARAAGKNVEGFEHPSVLATYCAETEEEAREVAMTYLPRRLRASEAHYEREKYAPFLAKQQEEKAKEFPQFYSKLQRPYRPTNEEDRLQFVLDQAVGHNLIGTPETIIKRLKAFEKSIDLRYLLMLKDWAPQELVLKSMELLAKEVLPAFSEQTAASQV